MGYFIIVTLYSKLIVKYNSWYHYCNEGVRFDVQLPYILMEGRGGKNNLLTDEMLATRTLDGEVSAYEELVTRYNKSVFAIVYRMTGNFQDAEDITQDVFITVYQKLYQFDGDKKFAPWLHKIAINTCISSLRKKKKVVVLNFDESYMKQYEHENYYNYEDPDLIYEKKELKAEIESALLELPESYRLILVLRYQMDLNNQEIAEVVGLSRENIEVKVHRARKALRRILLRRWEERGNHDELPSF